MKLEIFSALSDKFNKLENLLGIPDKKRKLIAVKEEMSAPDFWQDQIRAVSVSKEMEKMRSELLPFEEVEEELTAINELASLISSDSDEDLEKDLEKRREDLEKRLAEMEFYSLFSDPHDSLPALLSIHANTGGVDAQDFALMLERMYLRFGERRGLKIEILDRIVANEAGIKSVAIRLEGPWAYGYLKSENGMHRLARISPFDGESLRQTSFASVEVVPELPDNGEVVIKDEDLRVDLFRSSGPGGQNVNKTESAVRLTHLPTGLVVACQSERSQHQNRENALKILKGKIFQVEQEKRDAQEKAIKSSAVGGGWGLQIRSYILYGTRLVKDHRTNQETSDVEGVFSGNLEPFMEAYLSWQKKNKRN